MNNTILKCLFSGLFMLFLGFGANAQEFATHPVKKGETIQGIAKKYNLGIAEILSYNKEVKADETLKPNTILVIPLKRENPTNASSAGAPDVAALLKSIQQDSLVKRKPIGFTSHKVRKRETLYGIAKRYNVTQDELKKYNKELYASQLRKKMILRIPKYKGAGEGDAILDPNDYEKYVVAPKETRWSIAHKYGITIDSLVTLNPQLPKNTTYLAEGQELLMPKMKGASIKQQDVQLYTSYTVPPKQNFYRLEQEFGVKADEIVRLNPEITQRGGLEEGMVIRIPKKKVDVGEINTDNYIFYEVKPKQNEFRLTRKFGMTWAELTDLNPDLAQGLKAGMILKLPKDKVGDFEVKNSLVLDKINLLDSINTVNRPKLIFMLPFRLDKIDVNSKSGARKIIQRRNDVKLSLGLYTGAMVALDSISKLGISVDVKTYDNQLDINKTREILRKERLNDVSAIVGPLDAESLKEVAVQAASFEVPVMAPITSDSDISLKNVYFSIPTDVKLRERLFSYIDSTRVDQNIIIVSDDKHKPAQEAIMGKYPDAKTIAIKQDEKNISMNINRFTALLTKNKENWVFLETDNFKMVSSVISILNSNNTDDTKIRLFTTDKNKAFDNEVISLSHLSNLQFTYPSVYKETVNDSFKRAYRNKFGSDPDKYATRGFDMTFDLLLKLAYKNNLYQASKIVGLTEYTGNKFNYAKDYSSGFFNTASYIMMYDAMRIKEVKL
ncbi:LysM peptidoglycan-binding domain-containing protein [Costertonia aggregata]|uniref:LysM peptidoglycan-binding domain-containing protein n=1 Tax=Costertonia aggregata TaxID=343403 RepID=A0A7H9ASH4_9FLAO|nr:LysM peptidoglycan-binding domain-containing protein [Costertonia aggregata]QLG46404.1 LysM peptidoglycan-binding domain-containing protein [Costertonia aggregata]